MRNLYRIWALFIILLAQQEADAQLPDYHLQLFDQTAGIQPGTITAVGKDKRGCLWILYRRQVQRYDGKRIETFRPTDLYENMLCDTAGRIWVASSKRIFLFSERLGRFEEVSYPRNDSSMALGQIFQRKGGDVWLISNTGVLGYDEKSGSFRRVLTQLPLKKYLSVRTSAFYGDALFLRHARHLYRYNLTKGSLDSLEDRAVNKVFAINEDSVLVSTWKNDSYWYNFRDKRISGAAPPRQMKDAYSDAFNVRGLIQTSANIYIMASLEGIFEYNNLTATFRRLQFNYNGNKVATNDYANHIYLDREGYAWMATMEGVARFPVHHNSIGLLRVRNMNESLPYTSNNIRKIREDNDGNLWLATGFGFACWKKAQNKWEFFPPALGKTDRLAHPSIRGLAFDGQYLILGPTDLGIWLFDPRTHRYRRPVYEDDAVRKRSEGASASMSELRNSNDRWQVLQIRWKCRGCR